MSWKLLACPFRYSTIISKRLLVIIGAFRHNSKITKQLSQANERAMNPAERQELIMIAQEAAKAAAEQVALKVSADLQDHLKDGLEKLRLEMQEDFRREMSAKFEQHFGEMHPSNHTDQHARIDRFFKSFDGLVNGLLQKFVTTLIIVAVLCGVFGFGFFYGNNEHHGIDTKPKQAERIS